MKREKMDFAQISRTMFLLSLVFLACFASVRAQTTAFTYQGRFTDSTVALPTNGTYNMQFALFDAMNAPVGTAITVASVQVVNGIFTVNLDFGAPAFPANMERLLETRVFNPATAAYVPLSPRQPLTSAPFAIRSLNATTADNALNVGGTPAAQIIKEGDARLTDTRTPTAGSGNYIQNQNAAAQTSSNFNISGTGAANVFNVGTQYNIGGGRVLSVAGSDNTFAGFNTGTVNTGISNSFFGRNAGSLNTGGGNNSFVGRDAGRNNSTGATNSFFGVNAGLNNLSGSENVFVGVQAGSANTTGGNNTLVGTSANVGANNLTFATAIGSGAIVAASNTVVLGRSADTVQIPGTLNIGGTLSGNIVNAATQFNLGGSRVLISDAGLENLFVGIGSGATGVTGNGNAFFGSKSGTNMTTGIANSFFGRGAGFTNVSGSNNSFFGANSGLVNTGNGNSFFGSSAGDSNTTGENNSFFGALAGNSNTTGSGNLFFGLFAGNKNVGGNNNLFFGNQSGNENISGGGNSFFGAAAGNLNTGSSNVFIGTGAGIFNIGGSNNTMLGANATVNFGAGNLTYATAIGADAQTFESNSIVLGRGNTLDTVRIPGKVKLTTFGSAGLANLCFNTSLEISTCSSSLRYKTNIAPFNFGLNLVNRLKPITFDWKDGGMHDLGLGAEDVAAIEPLLVTYNKAGQIEGVKYDRIGVVLLNAVKEQQAQIEAQAKQINEQKLLIDGLKTLVCASNPTAAVCQ